MGEGMVMNAITTNTVKKSMCRTAKDNEQYSDPHLALIQGVINKSEDHFSTLYNLTVSKVFSLSYSIVGNEDDAEEVTCDVFTQAWNQAEKYDADRGSVLAWLFIICRSRSLDLLRIRKKQREVVVPIKGDFYESDSAEQISETMMDTLQKDSNVWNALSTLPSERRQILALHYMRGLTHAEISKMMDLPLGTIKSHIRRGLKTLSNLIEMPL